MSVSANFCYAAHGTSSSRPVVVREPGGDRVAPGTFPAPGTVSAPSVPARFGPAPSVPARSVPAPSVPAPSVPARSVPTPSAPAASALDLAGSGSGSGSGSAEDSDDELYLLGERIADLAARINVAESRMMTLIADFDRRRGWEDGFSSCAEWLAWRIGIKIGPARERVRTARALEDLPRTADALGEGSISYAKVRAITRVATPESEGELLELARAGSAAKLERTVRLLRKLSREGELTAEEARHRSRTFSVFVDGDGMYVVKGRLEPEAGAVLMRAVEAASDALFRRERGAGHGGEGAGSNGRDAASGERGAGGGEGAGSNGGDAGKAGRGTDDVSPEPKQRRADAVGLLAERALAVGFGGSDPHEPGGELAGPGKERSASRSGTRTTESAAAPRGETGAAPGDEPQVESGTRTASSSVSGGEPQVEPRVESGTRAERYQVVIHADAATLAEKGEPGRSDLDGIRVSAETSRRMSCDAAVVAMLHGRDGSVMNVGRRTRTIPPHIRRALEERDRGCRFPGCAGRFTEAHHVKHWADGGETSLRNTLLLCRRHHRTVHEGRVTVCVNRDGTVLFFTRTGRILADAPKGPGRADALRGRVADAPNGSGRTDALRGRVADAPGRPRLAHGAASEGKAAGSALGKGRPAGISTDSLPPLPPGTGAVLSNGAALYQDSAIPWIIEAAAREAMEGSL